MYKVFVLAFLLFVTGALFTNKITYAITEIPDGGAMWSDGYRPHNAVDVNNTVKSMWDNGKIKSTKRKGKVELVRGGRDPLIYSKFRGEKIIYDVYSGVTNQSKKQSWQVINSEGKSYFSFDGWAVNCGHH